MIKENVLEYIETKDMESLKNLLAQAEELEILHAYHDLSPKEQVIVFRLLAKEVALSVFEELDTDEQQNLLRSFTEERAIELVNEMAPDDRVRLLDEMPASVAKRLINSLSPEERKVTNALMGYAPETAGRIMTTEFISLRRDMTVEQALEKVSAQAEDKETVYTLFVTDSSKKLEGVLTLKGLLIARGATSSTVIGKTDGSTLVGDIMSKNAISVPVDTDQEEVARVLKELDLLAIPVVDKEGCIVGIVTIDDAVDILEEEATEDILDAAGFADVVGKEDDRSKILTVGSLPKIWAVRLPFLLIALAGGLLAGGIIEGFEEMLESVVVVAFFIPVILDMGGSVGSQSTTVFARGVVLGHINTKNFLKPLLKEVMVGLTIGIILGAIAAGVILIWQGFPMLALAVGLALAATMTLAATLGFVTPFAIMKLKMDQAAGSAPIITSIKDITGLFIYFGLVFVLMGSYLDAEPKYEITGMNVTVDGIHFFIDIEEETAVVIGAENYIIDFEVPEEITVMDEIFTVVETEE
ncbi:MAG: magnesium transporter [Defluviitaleaceae bacterium]|nr:magnesium transporter [Defluviitaleaceae bacterium]